MKTEKQVRATIHRENEVRNVLNREVPKLQELLKPFEGKKLRKADGDLVKKFTDTVSFDRDAKVKPCDGFKRASISTIYLAVTDYNVRLEVSLSFQDSDHTCSYHKGTAYIARLHYGFMGSAGNGKLKSISEPEARPAISQAKEWQNYQRAVKAKEAYEAADNKLFYSNRTR